ncbi:hypothetical protein TRFO_00793 [Tritrichomonas foetus]|uniref:Right handed beta helix domain-containing protein n=1 Tax=Tritrichomonas foetus TaxID=1144522 RepID=A0A1J4L3A5_9EUKA|nr:hypothetical protein TRFO_00793 [Tritrichomonas foetus]|eukprot:OHT17560.1 hypothetical protein TRFO_00793 [Tritrichomonas foetus]
MCYNSRFANCSCSKQGGSVFIQFVLYAFSEEIRSDVQNCSFTQNQALGGAGLYIKSASKNRLITIKNCEFMKNKCHDQKDPESSSSSVGGAGLFISSVDALVENCHFKDNKGIGADMALFIPGGIDVTHQVWIKHCLFEFNGKATNPSSFYLIRGSTYSIKATLLNCTFKGENENNVSHYFDTYDDVDSKAKIVLDHVYFCDSQPSEAFQGDYNLYVDVSKSTIKYQCINETYTPSPIPPTAEPTPCEYCSGSSRCFYGQATLQNRTLVRIENTKFENMNTELDGGAVYLINYDIVCINTQFTVCKSSKGNGGAVFVKLELPELDSGSIYANFTKTSFIGCASGGNGYGLFLDSSVPNRYFSLNECTFESNNPYLPPEEQLKDHPIEINNAGKNAALYIHALEVSVENCSFKSNNEDVFAKIHENTYSKNGIHFTDCIFDYNTGKSTSFYFSRKNSTIKTLLLNNCQFKGITHESKTSHYIDASEQKDDSSKILLQSVYFCDGNEEIAFGSPKEKFIDLKKSITSYYCDGSFPPRPEEIYFEQNENRTTRCDFGVATNANTTLVRIEKVTFQNFHSNELCGGAVYLTNYYVSCHDCKFNDCFSKAQGGAMYLCMKIPAHSNQMRCEVVNCEFQKCQAAGGGGLYATATTANRYFVVINCSFHKNAAVTTNKNQLTSESNPLLSGGALSIIGHDVLVEKCEFSDNQGVAADVLMFIPSGVSATRGILIKDSTFNFKGKKETPSSLFFARGVSYRVNAKLINCVFSGSLKQDSHYIDADNYEDSRGKLVLENVVFNNAHKEEVFAGNMEDYIDLDASSFSYKEKLSKAAVIALSVVIPLVVIVIALVLVVVFIKKRGKNETQTRSLFATDIIA